MTYQTTEQTRAASWKATSEVLPEAARAAGLYTDHGQVRGPFAYCLPPAYAGHNLLPKVREDALRLFAELQIPWHCSVDGGPSNHLLSSQVQCANALTAMVGDPERVRAAFAEALGTQDVLEIEPGRFLTFEYIGPTDFFGEARGGTRIRGAHCTSVDAASATEPATGSPSWSSSNGSTPRPTGGGSPTRDGTPSGDGATWRPWTTRPGRSAARLWTSSSS